MAIKTIRMLVMLGLLMVALISTVSAQQTNILLPTDASANHSDTVVVSLMANNVTNLANFDVNITYNPLVVNVTGVSVNDSFGGSSADAFCNLKNAGQGSVKLVSWNTGAGYTGNCHLADVTLEAVGTADQTTELGIIINGAANPDNDPIDPYPVASNGTFTVASGAVATTGDIVINEIMYDPDGTESWYEWIELYNNDTKEINVDGWILNGTIGGSNTILSGTMEAGTYLLIARNMAAFHERYPGAVCPTMKGNWSALGNGGDTINLWNSTPALIGAITYADITRENYTAERNATGGFEESLDDGGTPCASNSALRDIIGPVVNSVTLGMTEVTAGNPILVTVDATDDAGVVSVTAEGVSLTNQGGDIWKGSITAVLGIHFVHVCAGDAAGNVGWNNSTSYNATPPETTVSIQNVIIGPGEDITVPIMISHVADVSGSHINMSYNSSVVHVTEIVNGIFDFEVDKEIDNDSGYVRYAVMNLNGGLNGDVVFAYITLEAVGDVDDTSPLNLSVVSLNNGSTQIPRVVVNGTFTIAIIDGTLPSVTGPCATPSLIPTDTDSDPGWGETSMLSVNVTDENGVASVTVDLSDIGGSAAQEMVETSPGSGMWTVSTNVSAGTLPGIYHLQVNAMDSYGNSNTSVSIELVVRNNGDVDGNGVVNLNDAIYLARHALLVPGYELVNQYVSDVDGNGVVNLNDAIYLARHTLDYPGSETLH